MTEQDRATAARIVALYEDAGIRSGLLTYQIDMLRLDIAAAIAAARVEGREQAAQVCERKADDLGRARIGVPHNPADEVTYRDAAAAIRAVQV